MPINVTSANTNLPIQANTTGDVYVILPDVFVTSTTDAVNGANTTTHKAILVHGGLVAEFHAIELGTGSSGGNNRIHVTSTGSLFAESHAIDSVGGFLTLVNEGSIFGLSDGVFANGDGNDFINRGSIVGLSDGIDVNGDSFRLTNFGLIQGQDEGIEIFGSGYDVTNFGTIVSTEVSPANEAVEIAGNVGDSGRIVNYGYIAGVTAIGGSSGEETVINRGEILGDILLKSGNDRFDGRGGTVTGTVEGGDGHDVYLIDDAAIDIVENSFGGTDIVRTWASYTLPNNIETLILQGEQEIDGIGNDQDNTINGNNVANEISGGDGDDTLTGGWGDDILNGNDGNDSLRGHAGADRMVGGMGDDTYFIDVIDDVLVEFANEGTDHVFSPISYALRDYSQHLENLTLTGTADIDGTGNGQINTITGNDGDNTLNGAAGSDILIGGLGHDTFLDDSGADNMIGGGGNDVYHVDNAADTLVELAGEGLDTVFASLSFALRDKSQHLEDLVLNGFGDLNGTGNGQANHITGNAGNNILNGAGGNDTMLGGGGNDTFQDDLGADHMVGGTGDDTYFIDNIGDTLIEVAGQGIDSVISSISFSLRVHSQHLENLTLTGAGNINGTGNGQMNTITGNSGDNILNGAGGNDTLNGGAGDDTYNDDAGADRFEISVFDGLQNDSIINFSNTQDTIAIELGAFNTNTVTAQIVGANTIVTYGDGTSTLQLVGVNLLQTDIMFDLS